MDFEYLTRPLAKCAKLLSGGTPSMAKPEFWGGDIPWITPKDMGDWNGTTADHVTAEAIGNGTRLAPARTSFIAVRGMSLHNEIRVVRPLFAATFNQDIKAIQALNGVNERFLYYCLLAHKTTLLDMVESAGNGTGRLPTDQLENLPIPDVDDDIAKHIVKVLGDLDDKIDLLKEMNRTLEEIARVIFEAWFVDLKPVRAKAAGATGYRGMPQDLFDTLPNEFCPSEIGDIPSGWKLKHLDQIAEFLNGLSMQKYRPEIQEDSLPVIKIAELRNGISERTEKASASIPKKYRVVDGDFLFSWSGSLLARFWSDGAGALNQHLFKVTSEEYPMWFVASWVWRHLEEFQRIAASKATTMGHIQRGHLTEALVLVPQDGALKNMTHVMAPLFERQVLNGLEVRKLATLRDTLLPKLISGELRIPDLENLDSNGTRHGR